MSQCHKSQPCNAVNFFSISSKCRSVTWDQFYIEKEIQYIKNRFSSLTLSMILSVVVVNVVISSVVVVVVVVLVALQYDAQITKLNESFISQFFIILRSSDIKKIQKLTMRIMRTEQMLMVKMITLEQGSRNALRPPSSAVRLHPRTAVLVPRSLL